MRSIYFLLLLLLVSFVGCSERKIVAASKDEESQTEVAPKNIKYEISVPFTSPLDLEKYINEQERKFIDGDETVEGVVFDFRPLWEKWNLPRDEDGTFDSISSNTRWHAELFGMKGEFPKSQCVMLKISLYQGADRRYLFFKPSGFGNDGNEWQFYGSLDVLDNKYEGSPHQKYQKIISNEKGDWLVLRSLGTSGTGIFGIQEAWYKIDKDSVKEVLSFSVEGHRDLGNASDLQYKSTIFEPQIINDAFTLRIQYTISFGKSFQTPPKTEWLFSKRKQVTFVWSEDLKKFKVDEKHSELLEEEIDDEFGSWNEEKFLRYHFQELLKAAQFGNTLQKRWLNETLKSLKGSPQKQALQQALHP